MDTIGKLLLMATLVGLVHATTLPPHTPSPRRATNQINSKVAAVIDDTEDHLPVESGSQEAAGPSGNAGKYFMDTIMIETGPKQIEFGHVCEDPDEWEQRYERRDEEAKRYQVDARMTLYEHMSPRYHHEPHHDHYEFGYHRGNDHHFAERYEKAHPHDGHFQTKARWGDKHGGYGEHYWDFNHGDHHVNGDEEPDSEGDEEDAEGDGSSPKSKQQPGKTVDEREKRVPEKKKQKETEAAGSSTSDFRLIYDVATGFLVNEATGRRYRLTPIN